MKRHRHHYDKGPRSMVKPVFTIKLWTRSSLDSSVFNGKYTVFADNKDEAVNKITRLLGLKGPIISKFV